MDWNFRITTIQGRIVTFEEEHSEGSHKVTVTLFWDKATFKMLSTQCLSGRAMRRPPPICGRHRQLLVIVAPPPIIFQNYLTKASLSSKFLVMLYKLLILWHCYHNI